MHVALHRTASPASPAATRLAAVGRGATTARATHRTPPSRPTRPTAGMMGYGRSPTPGTRSWTRTAGSRSAPTSTRSRPATGGGGPTFSTRCASPSGCAATGRSSSTGRPPRATCCAPSSLTVDSDEPRRPSPSTCRSSRSSTAAGTGSTSRPATASSSSRRPTGASRPTAAASRPGHHRHHDVQPARLLRRPAARTSRQDPAVLEILDEVIVVDQGTQKVARQRGLRPRRPRRSAPSCASSSRPTSVARAASRAPWTRRSRAGASDYVLLLDDDVVCELEGILRAVTFADLAKQPDARRRPDVQPLRPLGDARLRRDDRRSTAGSGARRRTPCHGHDFAQQVAAVDRVAAPPHRRRLQRLVDVPDPDPGHQARSASRCRCSSSGTTPSSACGPARPGYPTVTLPGVAVWHVPWTEKDDTLDWQAYFHERNRLVSGAAALALRARRPAGAREPREPRQAHGLDAVRHRRDRSCWRSRTCSTGPERMHRDIVHPAARRSGRCATQYADGQVRARARRLPGAAAEEAAAQARQGHPAAQRARSGKVKMAAVGLLRQVTPDPRARLEHPEGIVPHVDQRWWRLAHFDSAIVSSADGMAASWYRRDPRQFRDQMARSAQLHAQLYREWPSWPRGTARRCPSWPPRRAGSRRSRASTTRSTGEQRLAGNPEPRPGAKGPRSVETRRLHRPGALLRVPVRARTSDLRPSAQT